MEQVQAQPAKKHLIRKKLVQRILAGFLAFAMALSAALLLLTRIVRPDDIEVSQSTADVAYQTLSGKSAYLSANTVERVRMLLALLGRQPKTAEEFDEVASMYVGRGNYAEAAVLYESSVAATASDDTDALANRELKLGSAYVLSGDMTRAEDCYWKALKYDDTLALAQLLLAQIYFEQNRYQESAERIRAYLELEPNDTQNRTMLGNLYESMQQYDLALNEYLAAYLRSRSATDCMNVARAALLDNDYALGEQYLTTYLAQNEDTDGSVHYLRGAALLGLESYADAETDMLEAIRLGYSDAADCYAQLTLCAYMQGDYKSTLDYGKAAQAIWKTPNAACLQRMGLAQMQLSDYASSIDYLRQSIAADATVTENYYYLATACLLTADYKSARDAYSTVITDGYLLQECYYNRAICYLQLEEYDAAVSDLLACLDAGSDESIRNSAIEILGQLGVEPPATGE